jgi:hypothetical protein
MDEKKEANNVLNIDGLKPVEPNALDQFQAKMTQETIPEIVKIVEKRRLKAAESRHWQLKC